MATLWNVGMIKFSFELMIVYMWKKKPSIQKPSALDTGKKYMRKNQLKKASQKTKLKNQVPWTCTGRKYMRKNNIKFSIWEKIILKTASKIYDIFKTTWEKISLKKYMRKKSTIKLQKNKKI